MEDLGLLASERLRLRLRILGVERIRVVRDLFTIGEAVAVGVGVEGVGSMGNFGPVGESVAVCIRVEGIGPQSDLTAVQESVAVGIRVQRIGSEARFLLITESVVVGVAEPSEVPRPDGSVHARSVGDVEGAARGVTAAGERGGVVESTCRPMDRDAARTQVPSLVRHRARTGESRSPGSRPVVRVVLLERGIGVRQDAEPVRTVVGWTGILILNGRGGSPRGCSVLDVILDVATEGGRLIGVEGFPVEPVPDERRSVGYSCPADRVVDAPVDEGSAMARPLTGLAVVLKALVLLIVSGSGPGGELQRHRGRRREAGPGFRWWGPPCDDGDHEYERHDTDAPTHADPPRANPRSRYGALRARVNGPCEVLAFERVFA